jgi:hypothetical protein
MEIMIIAIFTVASMLMASAMAGLAAGVASHSWAVGTATGFAVLFFLAAIEGMLIRTKK